MYDTWTEVQLVHHNSTKSHFLSFELAGLNKNEIVCRELYE